MIFPFFYITLISTSFHPIIYIGLEDLYKNYILHCNENFSIISLNHSLGQYDQILDLKEEEYEMQISKMLEVIFDYEDNKMHKEISKYVIKHILKVINVKKMKKDGKINIENIEDLIDSVIEEIKKMLNGEMMRYVGIYRNGIWKDIYKEIKLRNTGLVKRGDKFKKKFLYGKNEKKELKSFIKKNTSFEYLAEYDREESVFQVIYHIVSEATQKYPDGKIIIFLDINPNLYLLHELNTNKAILKNIMDPYNSIYKKCVNDFCNTVKKKIESERIVFIRNRSNCSFDYLQYFDNNFNMTKADEIRLMKKIKTVVGNIDKIFMNMIRKMENEENSEAFVQYGSI